MEFGILYVISTPIGNDGDITLRAIEVLRETKAVVCEELKEAARLLRVHGLKKELIPLNEHTEREIVDELIERLKSGESLSLISDCGTPLIADPGQRLVKRCLEVKINVIVVPGASSVLTALVRSGFSTNQFLFGGFVRRVETERIEDLKSLSQEKRTVVLLEAPYRLIQLLGSCASVMPHRRAYLGCNLTMPNEFHHYGTFKKLLDFFKEHPFKGEFVICFEGN